MEQSIQYYLEHPSSLTNVHQLSGHILECCMIQNGSRMVQDLIVKACVPVYTKGPRLQLLFEEVQSVIPEMCCNMFATRVVQLLLDCGTHLQVLNLVESILHHAWPLCFNGFGYFVILKALDVMSPTQRNQLVTNLESFSPDMFQNRFACRVLEKCFQSIPEQNLGRILTVIIDNLPTICKDANCSRLVQAVLKLTVCPVTVDLLMDAVDQNVMSLTVDQFGNFVVQAALKNVAHNRADAILSKLLDSNMLWVTMDFPYAYHVYYLVMELCNQDQLVELMADIEKDVWITETVLEGEERLARLNMLLNRGRRFL